MSLITCNSLVYKVCRVDNINGSRIFASYAAYGNAIVVYRLNKLALPPPWLFNRQFGLFAFDTLENAQKTCCECDTILECAHGKEWPLPPIFDLLDLSMKRLYHPYPQCIWPKGSMAFSELLPIREIRQGGHL